MQFIPEYAGICKDNFRVIEGRVEKNFENLQHAVLDLWCGVNVTGTNCRTNIRKSKTSRWTLDMVDLEKAFKKGCLGRWFGGQRDIWVEKNG